MKKLSLAILLIALLSTVSFGQNLTQTVRGSVVDTDSKRPLIGAQIVFLGSDPLVGTTTDLDGNFRFENISLDRITLQISFIGYGYLTLPNIVVNSGKEVVLNLSMMESFETLSEVVVIGNKDDGTALNDMSLISSRSISVEQTERFAGSFNDPSRILSNFAGVTSTQDGSNDIIVRGNSPKYIQWRLEGLEIKNPNHFADQNSVSGGISALNANLLARSDFYTGAFSPEYGDVLSGVYDVNMRAGNNEKLEATFGFGLLGTDLTLEGPFKKGYGGSYLINYRYSTISLVNDIGLADIDGLLKYQDASFKIVLPTKKHGVFSLFGLGGKSSFLLEDVKPDLWDTPGDGSLDPNIIEDFDKGTHLANFGIKHTLPINDNSFIKTSLSYSNNGIDDDVFESEITKILGEQGEFLRDSIMSRRLNYQGRLKNSAYRGAITYNNKLNAKNKIKIGTKYAFLDYDNNQSRFQEDGTTRFAVVDVVEIISTIRNFFSWKHRLSEDITIVSGVHNMNVLFNNKSTIEPRFAVKWKVNNTSSFNAGYGKHSTMESMHNYFTKVEMEDGSVIEPNKDLGLLKSHHFVLGYEKRFSKNLMAKFEVYYQALYDLPVENNDTSFYATINEGLEYKYVDLVNEGTGKNYGVELTIERFFDKNYYFLINGSVYNSKYKSLEGRERNTQYNGNYLVNVLMGKEFQNLGKKKNQTLSINGKVFYGGGKRIIPLLRDGQGDLAVDTGNNNYWDYEKAYDNKLVDIYQITLSASYKFNRPKATHEIFINLDNVTNTKGKVSEYYDESEPNSIGHLTQFGLFPNLMYRVYF